MSLKRWAALTLAVVFAYAGGRGCASAERHAGDESRLQAGSVGALAALAPRAGGGVQTNALLLPQAETEGTVVRVRDGDSIVVRRGGVGIEVRLDGVDSPELVQAFGRKAKKWTSDFALGKVVRLVDKGRDKYDRVLAEVFLPDGPSLNRELVAAGFAWWYRKHSTDLTLGALEQTARSERRGLWADKHPVPPGISGKPGADR